MTLPACDRIIELSEKATPGPWSHYQMTQDRGHFRYLQSEGSAVGVINTWPNPQPLADADFIAESRTLAPKIALARCGRLRSDPTMMAATFTEIATCTLTAPAGNKPPSPESTTC